MGGFGDVLHEDARTCSGGYFHCALDGCNYRQRPGRPLDATGFERSQIYAKAFSTRLLQLTKKVNIRHGETHSALQADRRQSISSGGKSADDSKRRAQERLLWASATPRFWRWFWRSGLRTSTKA